MNSSALTQPSRPDDGFTLTELMVVLLIVGVLMAVAIPLWLSARKSTGQSVAQSTAQSALSATKSIYGANGAYGMLNYNGTFASLMASQYPDLSWYRHTWSGNGTEPSNSVSVQRFDNYQSVVLAVRGGDKCWEIATVNQPSSTSGLSVGTHYAWAPAGQYGCAVAPPTTSSGSTPAQGQCPAGQSGFASSWACAQALYPQGGGSWWAG